MAEIKRSGASAVSLSSDFAVIESFLEGVIETFLGFLASERSESDEVDEDRYRECLYEKTCGVTEDKRLVIAIFLISWLQGKKVRFLGC